MGAKKALSLFVVAAGFFLENEKKTFLSRSLSLSPSLVLAARARHTERPPRRPHSNSLANDRREKSNERGLLSRPKRLFAFLVSKEKKKIKEHFYLSLFLSSLSASSLHSTPLSTPLNTLVDSLHLGNQVGRARRLDRGEVEAEQLPEEGGKHRRLLQRLKRARGVRLADRRQLLAERDHPVEPREEPGVLDVGDLGEDALRSLVGLDDHVLVELLGVQAERLVEGGALVVVEVHGDVDLTM